MEGGDSEFCEFYTANFKGIFGGPWSGCVWQQAITCSRTIGCPKTHFIPQNRDLLVSQKTTERHLFPTLHPISPVISATATVVAFVRLRNSRFSFNCYTQREATPTPKSAHEVTAATSRDFLRERLQRAFTRANQLH